jgi:uncharacterized protein (TIGR02246 family)
MIKPACFAFFLFSFSFLSQAQSRDQKAILAVMAEEEKTWNAGDIEGYVNLYAPLDSTRMILSKGVAAGKPAILAFYQKYWPKEKMGTLKLESESIEILSREWAYVTGYFHVSYPDKKTVSGRYSGLMKKIKGRWYLYTDHSG